MKRNEYGKRELNINSHICTVMKIAFDAKRVYQNRTGLGHYSRTLVTSLAGYFPQHDYFLFAPKQTDFFKSPAKNIQTVTPQQFPSTFLKSIWRSSWVKKDLLKMKIDLYHGLSHEIPAGIHRTGVKSVVTVHDLIFERYPAQYSLPDRIINRNKIQYACRHADKVIAISGQTKKDLIDLYNVPVEKVVVCYQSCNMAFAEKVSDEEKEKLKAKYGLPEQFFLYVGTVIERKNLLNICRAMYMNKENNSIPLVVIGEGGRYLKQVKNFVNSNNLSDRIIFLSENTVAKNDNDFRTARNFPAIYQSALCMIYPSVFEGFGIPVLEALWSNLPVITSNVSCLPETGGDAAFYVDPHQPGHIAAAMQQILNNPQLAASMKAKGLLHAQKFSQQVCAQAVMEVYEKVMMNTI